MKIYLAGKIEKNCWRHKVVDRLREICQEWHCLEEYEAEWPKWGRSIFGIHDYVGPYFVSCGHGCAHGGGSHGNGVSCMDHGGGYSPKLIVDRCLNAITKADLVFCWIDGPDAFGTATEIGFAKAIGKPVIWAASRSAYKCTFSGNTNLCDNCGICSDDDDGLYCHSPFGMWFPLQIGEEIVHPSDENEDDEPPGWNSPEEALKFHLKIQDAFVYFIEAVGLDRIKIGFAKDPESRLSQLQTGSPLRLKLLAKIRGDESLEKRLHVEFKTCRVDGEWFHATSDLRSYISSKGVQ